MRTRSILAVSIASLAWCPAASARAADERDAATTSSAADEKSKGILPIPDYDGGLWERSCLAGDLFNSRRGLAEKGIQLEVDWTQYLQSVVSGGVDSETNYGGNLDYLISFDLDRMGLMRGAMVKMRGQTRYGENVNDISGQILPVNLQALIPESPDDVGIAITDLTYYQYLSEKFGVFLGKFDTFNSDPNAFASGRGASQFMNMNFVFSGVSGLLPYSTLGGGAVWLPTPDIFINTSIFTTQDSSTTSGFGDVGDGWTWAIEGDFQYRIGSLPGGQNVGFAYSWDSDFINFNGRFTISESGGIVVPTSGSTWMGFWSGWQYLHVAEPATGPINLSNGAPDVRGFGFFWRAGIADSDTNPVNWSASAGIGGVGVVPGRIHDRFGAGYFYNNIETDRLTDALGYSDYSQGFEAFYNFVITPAVELTLDAQVVSAPAPNVDTGVVLGMRLFMRF